MKKNFPSFKNYREKNALVEILNDYKDQAELQREFFKAFYYLTSLYVIKNSEWIPLADAAEALSHQYSESEKLKLFENLVENFHNELTLLPEEYVKRIHPPDVKSASLAILESALWDNEKDKALEELEKLIILADDSRNIFEKILEFAAMNPPTMPVVNSLFSMYLETDRILRDHYLYQALRYLLNQSLEYVPEATDSPDFPKLFMEIHPAQHIILQHLWTAANNAIVRKDKIEKIITHSVMVLDEWDSQPVTKGPKYATDAKPGVSSITPSSTLLNLNLIRFLKTYLPESEGKEKILNYHRQLIK